MLSPHPQIEANGLTDEQVIASREANGSNALVQEASNGLLTSLKNIFKEPMFLLLLAAAAAYIISGRTGDAIFMIAALVVVYAISLYQESRSRNALEALKKLTQPQCKVIRNGIVAEIKLEDVVVGDVFVVEEGSPVPADGKILRCNDFTVNESMLTGESLPVIKKINDGDDKVYRGTTATSGSAVCVADAVGNSTRIGGIGKAIEAVQEEDTPLQVQIGQFVKVMAITGIIVFCIVWGINFSRDHDVPGSLLKALTLAMSVIPEEIPVAFATFMAMGAWRLMKEGVIVKQTKTVETLGSATVICTDKTGTITENKMSLARLFVLATGKTTKQGDKFDKAEKELIDLAMWSSETSPFDPMEIALHEAYQEAHVTDERSHYHMVHEYPLDGRPPMMTHVFENRSGHRIIAAKGAPEAMIQVSQLSASEEKEVLAAAAAFSAEGYRVLGVGETEFTGYDFPTHQQQFKFRFKGLVAFYDPPKKNIADVFRSFYRAGIQLKIITGDNALTTETIARQTGFKGAGHSLSGDELIDMEDDELRRRVKQVSIFTRMFPEAKLRVINALKANGEIVAMTGDGVNDGPALKAAHIGIAMGRGSETARQASSLLLADDDLQKMVTAIALGRKIYVNLKKAIQYIISIHIPIILTVFVPLALGWIYPNIFSPVHIIFLEIIMGPTCSIIYEHEPLEKDAMERPPRPFTTTFFQWNELATSVVQGVAIAAGVLAIYQYAVYNHATEGQTRAMVYSTLITANIFLTLVNRSFYYSLFTTLAYKNPLVPFITLITAVLSTLFLVVPPLKQFFGFDTPALAQVVLCIAAGIASVVWFEGWKWLKRRRDSTAADV